MQIYTSYLLTLMMLQSGNLEMVSNVNDATKTTTKKGSRQKMKTHFVMNSHHEGGGGLNEFYIHVPMNELRRFGFLI